MPTPSHNSLVAHKLLGERVSGIQDPGAGSVEAGFQEDSTLDWAGQLYSIFFFFFLQDISAEVTS